MKVPLAAFTGVLVVALTSGNASGEAGRMNLSWNDCGSFGDAIETFSCDTNAGFHTIVGSYIAPTFLDSVTSSEIVLYVQSETSALPDWWQLRAGSCRAGSLSVD